MAGQQELPVQQKREVDKAQEPTTPMRAFLPTTDIFETEDTLTVVLEMPGVDGPFGFQAGSIMSLGRCAANPGSMGLWRSACPRSLSNTRRGGHSNRVYCEHVR